MFGKVTKPCDNCPFRIEPRFLGLRRAPEIADSIRAGQNFPCHKTTGGRLGEEQECAGAVKIRLREGFSSQMMRICSRLKNDDGSPMFDPEDYTSGPEVYESFLHWEEAMQETLTTRLKGWARVRALSRLMGKPLIRRSR